MKKAIIVVLILALVAGISISGTMAWLQDDDSSVNTMVVGDVSIEQHEYEREKNEDGSYKTATIDNQTSYVLKKFEQSNTGHPIYPATELDANGKPYNKGAGNYDPVYVVRMSQVGSQGGVQVFTSPNAIDKIVTVKNTGINDVYVRTLVAFEMGSIAKDRYIKEVIEYSVFMADRGVWKTTSEAPAVIKGNNYWVVELVYGGGAHLGGVHAKGVLPAGETTYASLNQVYMHATATNQDCIDIDGNNNGLFDVLVVSQAVQSDGFENATKALDAAFGDVTADTAPAMFEAAASLAVTGQDIQDAINNGSGEIILGGDVDLGSGGLIIGG